MFNVAYKMGWLPDVHVNNGDYFRGSPRVAAATVVAATQAAPPISPFIWPMPADGLIDIPPLSNVTPKQ